MLDARPHSLKSLILIYASSTKLNYERVSNQDGQDIIFPRKDPMDFAYECFPMKKNDVSATLWLNKSNGFSWASHIYSARKSAGIDAFWNLCIVGQNYHSFSSDF